MDLEVIRQWQALIDTAEGMDIGSAPFELRGKSPDELKSAAMAMVIYNSRLLARRAGYGFAMDVRGKTLFIYKIRVGVRSPAYS